MAKNAMDDKAAHLGQYQGKTIAGNQLYSPIKFFTHYAKDGTPRYDYRYEMDYTSFQHTPFGGKLDDQRHYFQREHSADLPTQFRS